MKKNSSIKQKEEWGAKVGNLRGLVLTITSIQQTFIEQLA